MANKEIGTDAVLSFSQRESALRGALEKGVPADALIRLGHETSGPPEDPERKFIKWATVATLAMVGGGVAATIFVPDVNLPETVRQVADLVFTPGNAPVAEATLKTAIRQMFQWGIYFGESSLLIGYLLNGIKSRLTKSDQLRSLADLQTNLKRAIEKGEAPIMMPKGYAAIDLGTGGDAIGRQIGEKLGWGKSSLPLVEGPKNVSGFELWAQIPNPSTGIEKKEFFAALDRIGFGEAKAQVICPVKENQAFLPDPKNKDHFDLNFDEIMDRIGLMDEYCRERKLPPKSAVIVCDETVGRTVGPYVAGREKIPQSQSYSLREAADRLNESRPTNAKIIIADPTKIVLEKLNSPEYNPKGLPVELWQDTQATEIYGPRFVDRAQKLGIITKTDGDPKTPSLKAAYDINDVGTRQSAVMLPMEDTVAIIIDNVRALATPYKSLIVSEVVSDWVVDELKKIVV